MKNEKFVGYEKAINDALVAARGHKVVTNEDKIAQLERKLETARLTHAEIADIHKQIKQLKGR